MLRAAAVLASVFAFTTSAWAQTPSVVTAVAVSPEPADRLAGGQNLSVRVAYESDQPLRFKAEGYNQGRKHPSLATNPSPVYPAGKGEAIVWVFAQPGARLDELRVSVSDAAWQQLTQISVPVQAAWRAGVPSAPEAAWVRELNEAARKIPRPAPPPESFIDKVWSTLLIILVPVAFLSVLGYPLLQLFTLWKLRGPARLLSALPLSFMLPVYGFCLYALSQGSNLWPLYAIFASPVAFIVTLVIFLVARHKSKAQVV